MARWLLTQGHYLNTIPPTEWEYKETSRETGRQVRRVFHVPMYLDPKDMADWNSPDGIVVSNGNNAGPRDIVFVGEPTPDMRALDDEAKAITASLEHKWIKRPEDLIGDYSQSIIMELTKQMTEVAKGQAAAPANPVSTKEVSSADFEKLQMQVAELMALNEELKTKAARRA
jgi:hypothetical protein